MNKRIVCFVVMAVVAVGIAAGFYAYKYINAAPNPISMATQDQQDPQDNDQIKRMFGFLENTEFSRVEDERGHDPEMDTMVEAVLLLSNGKYALLHIRTITLTGALTTAL